MSQGQQQKQTANVLFTDIFDVKDIDPNGKRFDRGNASLF